MDLNLFRPSTTADLRKTLKTWGGSILLSISSMSKIEDEDTSHLVLGTIIWGLVFHITQNIEISP